ncbi:protein kinase, partial [bacterium]|nr:protein kinase [bacterium]
MAPAEDQNGRKKRKRIGGFEVLSRVGRGGMGIVYKARQVSMNRIVALKILPPSRAKNATYVQRFLREARSAAQLSHTNIVQAIDVGNADGYYYFAMEFVDGETVQALLEREGVLDERHALTIATAVAHALDHAHRHGIVHRDVKPGNIMIDRHGAVKLADLGLARSVEPIDTVTVDGVGVGTPHYIAPEQARGETDVDCRADIYSLGATLYHLLTGEPPFDGPTSAVVAAKHITMPLPSPKDKNPALSQGVCRLIRRMMAKKPNGRPQTPAKLLVEIEDALEGKMRLHPEGAPDGAEKHPARRRARKSHTLLWLLLAGVLAAGVGAVIALNRPGNDAAGLAAQTQQAEAAYDAAEAMRAERPDEALAAFRAIVRKYPRTEWAGRAAIRMEALERLEGPKVVEKPPTEPGPREAAPTEQGTAEDLAALEARCNAFVKKDNLGDAIAAVDAFLQKNPDGENTEAAQTLKTQTLALADARYATLVLTADSAAADGDYVKARAALTTAAALGIPGFADGAKALLPDLDALQTRAAEEAKWRDTMARAIQATEEGRCDQALEALEAARDLELDDIEARIAKQAEIIEAARTEAVDAAVTAYTPFGDEVQSLLAARQYDDADALLTEVARRPELALAADHVAADVEAVKLLRAFWLGVEVGIEAKKGTSLTFGAASGTVTDVRGGNVILSANNVEFKVNIRKLPARQALLHAKFEDRSVAARARVVLLLAERVDLDRVPAALAAAGDTPYAAVYKARLERALGATAGAEKSRRETDAQAAWRKIAAFASPKLTAPRAKQLVGMLDRFTEQFQGTKAQADVLEDSSALRARAAKVAGAWVKLFDGKSLRGWTSVIRREGSAATVRKDGALEVVGARTLLHTFGGEDVAIRARVRRTGAYNVSLYVRTDAGGDNGYYGWYDGAHFRIGKLVEGDGATLASARIRGPRKDVVDLMFAASGSSLALTADGEIVARAKDSTFGTGLAGVGVYKRTTAFFGRIEA